MTAPYDTVVVDTEAGRVSGTTDGSSVLVRGVPFAAPPVGPLRFEAPRPAARWEGVRPGLVPGAGAVQPRIADDPWNAYFNPDLQSLDCLTLEVHTPTLGAAGLPVMVWIHGGGFIGGVGSAPAHSGRRFAEDGIVHVAVNYRLALDGFVLFEDSVDAGADNIGLRDQVAALEWVQRNIARFGGDPAKVTIAGQSAGAMSVAALLAVPAAVGLFRSAIVQSPIFHTSREAAAAIVRGRQILEEAGLPTGRNALRDLDDDATRALTAHTAMAWGIATSQGQSSPGDLPFLPAHDTPFLPRAVHESVAAGASADVAVLAGTVHDELAGIIRPLGLLEPAGAPVARALAAVAGADEDRLAAYRSGPRPGVPDGALLNAVWTDVISRLPTIELLERHAGPGFLYEFTWQSPGSTPGMGSEHTFDIPFARDDFASVLASGPIGRVLLGDEPPQALATAVHGAFRDFVVTGRPGWPAYETTERATMRFDTESLVVPDLAGAERTIWQR